MEDVNILGLEITERCNFQCVHCYLERKVKPKINLEIATAIADIAYDAGFAAVYITGGEPMLHPQFNEIYEVFRRQGYVVTVYTNASVLRDSTLQLFKEIAPLTVQITMYGMSEETYYATTKVRQFSKVVKNIRRYREEGINVLLKYHLLTCTKHDLDEFLSFANELECDITVNAQIIPMLNGDPSPLKYRLNPAEINKFGLEKEIDFSLSGDGFGSCDAGRNLFIDSQGIVRGCPVLHTNFDQTALDDPAKAIAYIKQLFEDFHKKRKLPLCPAWLNLEGSIDIKKKILGASDSST